ncbi:MAG: D-aminoacyl-tRNA deacylase [Candidatus Hadarchaeales archaeon]
MFIILASTLDPAAVNITEHLRECFGLCPNREEVLGGKRVLLLPLETEVVSLSKLPQEAEEILVASRHASETGRPSLTVHVPGQLEEGALAMASPCTVKKALLALNRLAGEEKLNFQVSLEATHHGPTHPEVPVTFVEIGGSEEYWRNKKAGEVVAAAMVEAVGGMSGRLAVGVGGPHYAPRHTEVSLKTDVAIGHILPRYAPLSSQLVELAVKRTKGKVELLAADWKGLSSSQREVVKEASRQLGVELVKESELLREFITGGETGDGARGKEAGADSRRGGSHSSRETHLYRGGAEGDSSQGPG